LAPAWAGWLLANAMRVRRSWMLQPGGGGCSIQRPHRAIIASKNKVCKGSAAPRLSLTKNYFQRRLCRASCEQHFKADWQNFGAGKILPDLSF